MDTRRNFCDAELLPSRTLRALCVAWTLLALLCVLRSLLREVALFTPRIMPFFLPGLSGEARLWALSAARLRWLCVLLRLRRMRCDPRKDVACASCSASC